MELVEVLKYELEKHSRHSHLCVWINCISCSIPYYYRSFLMSRGARKMHELKTLWRGKIPLRDVKWTFSSDRERVLTKKLEAYRKTVWIETLDKYPDTYDGKVLILDDVHLIDSYIEFRLSFMRFSRVLTLAKSSQPAPGYGTLGFQAIIFSLEKKHILAGIRSERSQYCPLFHSVPGGILETDDLEGGFESACMREIEEETDVRLAPEKYLVAMMSELHGTVGVVALISGLVAGRYDTKERMCGNDEWVNQELFWYNVDELNDCQPDNSLEGLLFAKQERTKFMNTNASVLWP